MNARTLSRGALLTSGGATLAYVAGMRSRSAQAAGGPIMIGATIAETGAYSVAGKYALQGYQLYVDEQNKKGGWLGRKLELKIYDDASDPGTAVADYQKLVQQDHVEVLVGPYSSEVTAAVANIADQYKMPMITPEVASVAPFKRGLRYIFMGTSPSTRYVAGTLALAKAAGFKRIALTGEDTAFPRSIAVAVPDLAKDAGLEVVFNQLYPHNATDYTAIVQRIKAANPDSVMAISYFPDSVGILRALKQAGVTPKQLFFTIGPAEPNFYKEVGNDANGVLFSSNWWSNLPTQGNAAFVAAFNAAFGKPPDYHSAQNFAALQVLGDAVSSVGSLDSEKIREFMATKEIKTVCGTYHVDSTGTQLGYTSLTLQWQDGKQYVVWPSEFAQRKLLTPFRWA
ncbi:MAG: amino acid ABC transporter substrate-binding protein [Candidatus Eremiobacteraeota bacterium]|nr:amino acid ABC transporter substrate-binding protein [Candidatus Eremiobacteraeota bacterium]